MSKQTLHSNYFLAEEDMQDTDLENIDVDELKEHKVISRSDLDLFVILDTVDETFEYLKKNMDMK